MKIQPLSTEIVPVAAKLKAPQTKTAQDEVVQDTMRPGPSERLMDALRREPAVRVDSVERGRALVADTNYPAPDVLQQLADLFVEDSRRNK